MNCDDLNMLASAPQKNRQSSDSPVFEIFGMKLYNDDLLILGLLFFLYNQGTKDDELFLVLLLLFIT